MPALDGLRGVAILMVLLVHTTGGWNNALQNTVDTAAMPPLEGLPSWLLSIGLQGAYGVQLFFIVSAFTLTMRASQDTGGLPAYALRRIARIGPGYWLAAIAYTLAAGTAPRHLAPDGTGPTDWMVAALFGQVWQGGAALAVVPGGWSVSCEAAFYCALPFVLYAVDGRLWRGMLLTGVALVIAQLWARHLMLGGHWTLVAYFHPIVQAPVFLLGIAGALLAQQRRVPRVPWAAIGFLALGIVVLPLLSVHPWRVVPHLAFALVAAPAVVLAAAHPPRLLSGAALRRVGEVSYSMYLIHFALLSISLRVAEWMAPADDWRTLAVHFTMTAVASFGIACLTHRWIEQPAIRWAGQRIRRRGTLLQPSR